MKIVLVFLVLCFSLSVVSQTFNCCGTDPDDFQGNDQFFYLVTPPNTVTECHRNIVDDDDYLLPTQQGWAHESNGCHENDDSFCSPGSTLTHTGWCDADDAFIDCFFTLDIEPCSDDDDEGGGSNSPADDFTDVISAGTCGNEQTITRTWFSDTSCTGVGRLQTAQTIFIEDTREPTIAMPNDHTYECAPVNTYFSEFSTAEAFDTCNTMTISSTSTFVENTSCAVTVRIDWTFSDGCFTSTLPQFIGIRDTLPPVAVSRGKIYTECNNIPGIGGTQPTAVDICQIGGTIAVQFVSEQTIPGSCDQEFTIIREYSMTDPCGNSDTTEVVIEVVDITPPRLQPDIQTGIVTFPCIEDVTFRTFTATDDCSVDIEVIDERVMEVNPEIAASFATQRVTAVDECGNSVTRVYTYVAENINVVSDVAIINTPAGAIAKGSTFSADISASLNSVCDTHLVIAVDVGAATLQPGSDACFQQAASGVVYCDYDTTSSFPLALNLAVPANFLPNFLVISARINQDRELAPLQYSSRAVIEFV